MIQTEQQLNKELNKKRITEKLIFLRYDKNLHYYDLIEFDLKEKQSTIISNVSVQAIKNKKTTTLKNWVSILMGLENTEKYNYIKIYPLYN